VPQVEKKQPKKRSASKKKKSDETTSEESESGSDDDDSDEDDSDDYSDDSEHDSELTSDDDDDEEESSEEESKKKRKGKKPEKKKDSKKSKSGKKTEPPSKKNKKSLDSTDGAAPDATAESDAEKKQHEVKIFNDLISCIEKSLENGTCQYLPIEFDKERSTFETTFGLINNLVDIVQNWLFKDPIEHSIETNLISFIKTRNDRRLTDDTVPAKINEITCAIPLSKIGKRRFSFQDCAKFSDLASAEIEELNIKIFHISCTCSSSIKNFCKTIENWKLFVGILVAMITNQKHFEIKLHSIYEKVNVREILRIIQSKRKNSKKFNLSTDTSIEEVDETNI
jgi:hypothetical protein